MPQTFSAHTFDAHGYDVDTLQGEETGGGGGDPGDEVFGDDVESGVTPGVGDIVLKSTGGFA